MEYVLTAAEMKKYDETAIKEYGIGSLVLMERAALEDAAITAVTELQLPAFYRNMESVWKSIW